MTQNDALQALISAVTLAQQRGAYSLEEASAVHTAVTTFTRKQEPVPVPDYTGNDSDSEPAKQDKKKK